jgi:hypothetical protein
MWIMLSDCFYSIVAKDCGPNELLIRARRKGDIEKCFPDAKVIMNTSGDYLYRAIAPRDEVATAIAAKIRDIDYPNFKDSVQDQALHDAYVAVWFEMAQLQFQHHR